MPDNIPEFKIVEDDMNIVDLILKVGFSGSKGEAKRLVNQSGVSINGEKILDPNKEIKIAVGMVLKVGKRKFGKLIK